MKINTKFHGEIEISETVCITFKQGIPGFETESQFIILDLFDSSPFKVLQSTKQAAVAFIIADPWIFEKNYEFDLHESVIETLSVSSPTELSIYNILTIPNHLKQATINLVAPIVIHNANLQGIQVVLEGTSYTTKHSIQIEGC